MVEKNNLIQLYEGILETSPIFVRDLQLQDAVLSIDENKLTPKVDKIKKIGEEVIEVGHRIYFGELWDYIDLGENTPVLTLTKSKKLKFTKEKYLKIGDKIIGITNPQTEKNRINPFLRYYKIRKKEAKEIITQEIEGEKFHNFIIDKVVIGDSYLEKQDRI